MLTCLLTVESTFVFDDKRKLYVSLNFLMYVSPVFKAMFTHDFQERKTREVPLPGKEYEGFLEFLLCLHPNRQKPVDGEYFILNTLIPLSLIETFGHSLLNNDLYKNKNNSLIDVIILLCISLQLFVKFSF